MSDEPAACLSSLPFPVHCVGLAAMSNGGSMEATVRFSAEKIGASGFLAGAFTRLGNLAFTGALCGGAIQPATSRMTVQFVPPTRDGELRVRLSDCRVDRRSVFVLVNMLLAQNDPESIYSVSLRGDHSGTVAEAARLLETDEVELPGVFAGTPFKIIDEEPESGSYTFSATLASPATEIQVQLLAQSFQRWVEVVQAGGYELVDLPPLASYVEPSSTGLVVFSNRIEWSIYKLRADPNCINGIINIFAFFHDRAQPLSRLEIL